MAYFSKRLGIAVIVFLAAGRVAQAVPGVQWETSVEMDGGMSMPKQIICRPANAKEPPAGMENGECRLIEEKNSGSSYKWKAQCGDTLMVGDMTSTADSYRGTMKMTEKSGSTTTMKISGRNLGKPCEDRTQEKIAEAKQGLAKACKDGVEKMQGALIFGGDGKMCPNEKPLYCERIATLDGYSKASAHEPKLAGAKYKRQLPDYLRKCNLEETQLLPKLCRSALDGGNFDFLAAQCPGEMGQACSRAVGAGDFAFVGKRCPTSTREMCPKAMEQGNVAYIGKHCPTERQVLVRKYCAGRDYTADIPRKYVALCNEAARGNVADDENDGSASSGKGAGKSAGPVDIRTRAGAAAEPAEAPSRGKAARTATKGQEVDAAQRKGEDTASARKRTEDVADNEQETGGKFKFPEAARDVKEGVKDGVEKLKGLFKF